VYPVGSLGYQYVRFCAKAYLAYVRCDGVVFGFHDLSVVVGERDEADLAVDLMWSGGARDIHGGPGWRRWAGLHVH
jgi:hypothetical protein